MVCLLIAAVGSVATAAAQDPGGPRPVAEVVAILGFTNLGGDPALEWLDPGTVESVRTDLQRLGFGVVASEAVQAVFADRDDLDADPDRAAAQIGSALDVRWVIVGSYQRLGARLRLMARLYDTTADGEVSIVRSEGQWGTLFDLQDLIIEQLSARMRPGNRVSDTVVSVVPLTSGFRAAAGAIDGPPPPQPPAVISRNAAGRATIRAVRVEGLTIDGTLDEPLYQEVPPISGFIQQEPVEGVPATEQTEAWVSFDDDHFYLSVRCWDSAPESQWIVGDMRRDSFNVSSGEFVSVLLDTFYDRRGGVNFGVNPVGGRVDAQMTDERGVNMDWNPIWELRTGRFEGGWTFEAAFPFKSLRYRPGREQIWGFNLGRTVRWKNEQSFLVPISPARGQAGIMMASRAATIVGLEVPEDGLSLEVKPYAISDLTSDRNASPPLSNDLNGDVGLDVKYGVTQSLVADLTVNTDFAQVEADEQQINLTRFSLFFPEKREFFLENQGLFAFGGAGAGPFGGGGDTPVLFYSRRIGLDGGRAVPIDVGGRLTGRVGAFSVGVLNIQTDDAPASGAPATNFSVVRLKRDLLRRSSIGALFTRRSVSTRGPGSNETFGLDGTFGFYDNLSINTYWAKTRTSALQDDISYRAQLDYNGDRYGVQAQHLVVGTDFNPEVGFLRRDDFEQSSGSFRFSPRPQSIAAIRKLSWEGRVDYITDRAGVVETRQAEGRFGIEFENSDRLNLTYTRSYEFLDEPFRIAPDTTIPAGGYAFQDVRASYQLGFQRRLAGGLRAQHGSFFSGDRTSVGFNGRLELSRQLSLEPGLSFNWIDLPEGRFTTELITTQTTYTVTPSMFVSALLQYNSSNDSLSTNFRLRWEYQPGSELFVVYNEQRDTLVPSVPELDNRALVVKITRLFRF